MAAYLVRRLAYGVLTVFGVLLLLFVLFFAVTSPDDINPANNTRTMPA